MTPLIVGMVLLAALLHATWNAMAKSGGSPQFSIASYRLVGALISLPALLFLPLPAPASWPMLLISVVVHNLYYYSLSKSYRLGDLSQMYPLFRGLAPLLVFIGAVIVAGETLSPGSMLGIALISLGLISVSFLGTRAAKISLPALRWGLTTSVLIASYTVADGMGVRVAGNNFSYIFWLFVFEPLPIGLWLLISDPSGWGGYIRAKPGKIVAGALAAATAYAMVIYAMALGPMAMVSSLRETSVIFAALIGSLVFHEAFGRQRVVAAVCVCIGVILMKVLG